MRIELSESDIKKIVLEHIQQRFGGEWEATLANHYGYDLALTEIDPGKTGTEE